jgi:hypothetical protein
MSDQTPGDEPVQNPPLPDQGQSDGEHMHDEESWPSDEAVEKQNLAAKGDEVDTGD